MGIELDWLNLARIIFGHHTESIMDKNGLLQTDIVSIKGKWKRYIEQLYAANEKPDTSPLEEEHEVPIDALGPPFIEIEKSHDNFEKR